MAGFQDHRKAAASAPPLSYVLVAETRKQVHDVAQWLKANPISEKVEIVLAAPTSIIAGMPARMVPARVRLASAMGPPNKTAIKVAGAAQTTGLVVIVIDCEDDFAARLRDPFAAAPADTGEPGTELRRMIGELDHPTVGTIKTR